MLRQVTPSFILQYYRKHKKEQRRKNLEAKKDSNLVIAVETLIRDLKNAGIKTGDTILVHSSMSKLGFLQNGPETFVNALRSVIGESGNILMPTSPNPSLQLEYIKQNPVYDVLNTPSAMGAITEYFRKLSGVKRSLHPTEPVAALGPDAEWLTSGHFNQLTPYNSNSPFYRITEKNGKILMIGVTLDNAGTNLHTLEDAVDFKFPVYCNEVFEVEVIDEQGNKHPVKTKVHNPEFSKKRKCDELIPLFEEQHVLTKVRIGEADSLLINASEMLQVMIREYESKGITMYTPKGS